MLIPNPVTLVAFAATATLVLTAASSVSQAPTDTKSLRGSIRIDGSSTVFPLTEAVTEEFAKVAPRVNVTVGVSGTGGGFKRFCHGETAIADASRPIAPTELAMTTSAKIEFVEVPIAIDTLCFVVHPKNDWLKSISIELARRIFSEGGPRTWKEVDPSWPDRPIKRYSPGTDSGTFDYFKDAVMGKDVKIRTDISVSEDDNVLVLGVAGDVDAIGFFGIAFYAENVSRLRAVPVIGAAGTPVVPSAATVLDETYPLIRPLFLYVNAKDALRAEVAAYIDFYLTKASDLATEVGCLPLTKDQLAKSTANWVARRTGTQFVKDGKRVEGKFSAIFK
ncbi:MAG: PstS family phosphate ABC transporter substrate-binding protein [Planctomycetes bacterium]|nr:PstS family phosphate ABC transporter substrate-binding protein [Planctomycetota bacterium]